MQNIEIADDIPNPKGSAGSPPPPPPPTPGPEPSDPAPKPSKWRRFKKFVSTHRTRIIIALGLLALLPLGALAYLESTKQHPIREVTLGKGKPKPKTKPSPLTGVEILPELADRPIYSVVIENHQNARPQSGLADAGVVYEALAEGGITRFQAFYLENRSKEMGPIRSLRTYFVDWALEFNAPVAHVGGNADALDIVAPLGMKDMNQFAHGGSFYRTRDRLAPHNVYTTADLMDGLMKKLNYYEPSKFTPSPRKKDEPAATADHPAISINYSYSGFQVQYQYEKESNSYLRSLAGAPHNDRNSGAQIKVKNVVVQYMPTSYGFTRIGESTVTMGTPGSGRALVFRDGTVVEGTWSKKTHKERTKLMDASGKEIKLNPGNTWYSIVPTDKTVSY
ncbi:MAG TPA: DUF3048 domain-containing protein [Candidatus Dormibacteraeota bacterium]|nr:DUF3048 domain-containing protein [Candidatus Dormibacteraeota bacterium]